MGSKESESSVTRTREYELTPSLALLNQKLPEETSKKIGDILEKVIGILTANGGGGGGSSGSENSENSENSETSETSESAESSAPQVLGFVAASKPKPDEWGVLLAAAEQFIALTSRSPAPIEVEGGAGHE